MRKDGVGGLRRSGASKPFDSTAGISRYWCVFPERITASAMHSVFMQGRVAVAYVQGLAPKGYPRRFTIDGFEHPVARDTSGDFFLKEKGQNR